MTIAVANVADLFTGLSDDDIRAAAQHPQGFPDYLTVVPDGPCWRTLRKRSPHSLSK